jgi:divalent metal cation (Fe/Co/Zn/Cd) transporter
VRNSGKPASISDPDTAHQPLLLAGIVWLALTAAAMFVLAAAKHRSGHALGKPRGPNRGPGDLIDGLPATAVLLGLTLNAAAGLWWVDPAAAFVIVYYGAREGWHALRETTA